MTETENDARLTRNIRGDLSANETTISLDAARHLPAILRGGKPVDRSTIFRWVTSGLRVSRGRVVKLESIRWPGQFHTTASSVLRFAAAITDINASDTTAALPRSPRARQREISSAELALAKAGI